MSAVISEAATTGPSSTLPPPRTSEGDRRRPGWITGLSRYYCVCFIFIYLGGNHGLFDARCTEEISGNRGGNRPRTWLSVHSEPIVFSCRRVADVAGVSPRCLLASPLKFRVEKLVIFFSSSSSLELNVQNGVYRPDVKI